MNPTPCPFCNEIRQAMFAAYVEKRWSDLLELYAVQAAHEIECVIINGDWYKSLWPNAVVVEVTP